MLAARRHSPYGRDVSTRHRYANKNLFIGDLISLLVISLVFLLLLYLPAFNAHAFLFHTSQVHFSEGFRLDYLTLLSRSLPGMSPSKGEALLPEQNPVPGLRLPFSSYPQLLLHNELVGFKAGESIKKSEAVFNGNFMPEENNAAEDFPPEAREENVSFLTDRKPDSPREMPLRSGPQGKPLVLIYHTHASESFVPLSGKAFSDAPEQTVVALGAYLAGLLEHNYAIPVLHHKGVYDNPRNPAYERARPAIEQILKQNPQIQIVVDLHRDGVARRFTTANIKGSDTGRLLFVVGTRHEQWYDNLRFALFLQKITEEKYPGLSRGINKYNFSYNQNLHPRSIIIEVGGHENSRSEVERTIPYLAEVISSTFD